MATETTYYVVCGGNKTNEKLIWIIAEMKGCNEGLAVKMDSSSMSFPKANQTSGDAADVVVVQCRKTFAFNYLS